MQLKHCVYLLHLDIRYNTEWLVQWVAEILHYADQYKSGNWSIKYDGILRCSGRSCADLTWHIIQSTSVRRCIRPNTRRHTREQRRYSDP